MDNALAATPFIQSFGWALVHFLWQGTVIAGAVAAALRGLAGAASTTRYAVACAGLLVMLAAPAATFVSLSTGTTEARPNVASSGDVSTVVAASATEGSAMRVALPATVIVWMAGVFLLSTRIVMSAFAVERLKRTGTQEVDERVVALLSALSRRLGLGRSVRALQSAIVDVPTVVGYLRPVILLPTSLACGLPVAHIEAVIAHELAHVRRHDYLVNVGQAVIETVLFYHPAVWWCSRQIRIEREHCCDDIVVHACEDRLAYIAALADLEDLRRPRTALALRANAGRLVDRVRRLLATRPEEGRLSPAWVFASALVVALVLVVSASTSSYADVNRPLAPDPPVEATLQLEVPVAPAAPLPPRRPQAPAPRAVPSIAVPPAPPVPPPAPPAAVAPQAPAPPAVPSIVPPTPPTLPTPRTPPAAVAPQVPAPPAVPSIAAPPAPPMPPLPPAPVPPPTAPSPIADSDVGRQRLRAELETLRLGLDKISADLRRLEQSPDSLSVQARRAELAELQATIEALRKQLEAIRAR